MTVTTKLIALLLVPQRLDRIESRRARSGEDAEQNPREGAGAECGQHR